MKANNLKFYLEVIWGDGEVDFFLIIVSLPYKKSTDRKKLIIFLHFLTQ